MSIHEPSRFKRFMSGRGYFVALAVCLLAVGGAAVASFGDTLFVRQPSEPSSSTPVKPVEQIVTNQPDDRKTTTATTTATVTTAEPITTTSAADLFILPFGNAVSKAYSAGQPAYSVTMGDWRTHDGTDFAGKAGGDVKALADGTVTAVEKNPLWGTVITLDHGMDVLSRYCGVEPRVKPGDKVAVGTVIGQLATIPCEAAEEPHLHLEMSVDGRAVDPVAAIGLEVRPADSTTSKTE